MKQILFLFIFIIPFFLTAQVSESVLPMSQGSYNSLTITLKDISQKDAENVWKDYMKSLGNKTKYLRKEKEYFVDDASVPQISSSTIDIYSKSEKTGNDILFTVWFDLGGGYLTSKSQPEKYTAAVTMLNDYQREISRFKTNELLKTEEKTLSQLNSDLKRLVNDKEDYEKEIKKAEERIASYKAKIEQNIKDQSAKQTEITKQQAVVEKVKTDLSKI
ncbi:MAG: hypothetical protein J5I59_01350 [Saprospiraceae bacterium]|nr:hypothetical protein [Saprospiraceae bacterium]